MVEMINGGIALSLSLVRAEDMAGEGGGRAVSGVVGEEGCCWCCDGTPSPGVLGGSGRSANEAYWKLVLELEWYVDSTGVNGYCLANSDGVWTGEKYTLVPDKGDLKSCVGLATLLANAARFGDGGKLSFSPNPLTLGDAIGAASVAALSGVVLNESFGGIPG